MRSEFNTLCDYGTRQKDKSFSEHVCAFGEIHHGAWFEEQLKVLAPLGRLPTLTAAQIDATYDGAAAPQAGLPTVCDLVADGAWLCGPPEHIAEKLAEIHAQLPGLERVTIGAGALGIPPSVIKRNIEWFGREVLPKFQETP